MAYVPFAPIIFIPPIAAPGIDIAQAVAGAANIWVAEAIGKTVDYTQEALDEAKAYADAYFADLAERELRAIIDANEEALAAIDYDVDGKWAALTTITAASTEGILGSIADFAGGVVDFMTEPLNWLAEELGEFVGAFAAGFWGELEERL